MKKVMPTLLLDARTVPTGHITSGFTASGIFAIGGLTVGLPKGMVYHNGK
jgi:hypothetical protein